MGQLIRYVCAHEVGHTLGLLHNFLASSTVPVDSLRSKRYVEANGFCPSIMDYARFNYVAQPEDGLTSADLKPRIGVYDKWAIEWGYKWLTDFKSKEDETNFMSSWVTNQLEKDKRIWFGGESSPLSMNWDYKRQSEDLGDNAMKAGYYGIQNLKRIVPNLIQWTKEPNKNYDNLRKMNDEVVEQYKRYLFHAASYIGGYQWTEKNSEQNGYGLSLPGKDEQKAAVQFINNELFTTPKWLLDDEIFRLSAGSAKINIVNPGNINRLFTIQGIILTKIISYQTYTYLNFQQSMLATQSYNMDELLTDVEAGIWKELNTKKGFIDIYRRNLQKTYIEQLIRQLSPNDPRGKIGNFDGAFEAFDNNFNDALGVIKDHLRQLLLKINAVLPSYKEKIERIHLIDLRDRIKKALYEQESLPLIPSAKNERDNKAINSQEMQDIIRKDIYPQNQRGCWDNEF
jgi:Met-zincin